MKIQITPPNENYPKYLYHYFSKIIKNFFTKQKIYSSNNPPSVSAPITLTKKIVDDWHKLFFNKQVDSSSFTQDDPLDICFPYFSSVNNIAFIELLTAININSNNLLFAHWNFDVVPALTSSSPSSSSRTKPLVIGQKYEINVSLLSLSILTIRSLLVCCLTKINNTTSGETIFNSKNYFKVTNVDTSNITNEQLPFSLPENELKKMRGLSKRTPLLNINTESKNENENENENENLILSKKIYIPSNMAMKFARVSGDLSINHTTKFTAKVFLGYPKAFLQGLCSSSFVLKTITNDLNVKLKYFEISFCNPVFVDQYITFNFSKNNLFEITDDNNRLLAFGHFLLQ
ncbi:MAG: hypothetical protein HQK51_14260 [Oligoflexia bacterium]|nr:hypothetical protein [Oligoflexia bacterium]